jgi:hypothetical protein
VFGRLLAGWLVEFASQPATNQTSLIKKTDNLGVIEGMEGMELK